MQSHSSLRRKRLVRIFTLLGFFHFSGLNNGFTFMVTQAQGVQSVNFAPVFIRSLCFAINPLFSRKIFQPRTLKVAISYSGRILQFSSQSAILRYHPCALVRGLAVQIRDGMSRTSRSISQSPVFASLINSPRLIRGDDKSEIDSNPNRLQTRSLFALRKTDERDPEKKFELHLTASNRDLSLKIEECLRSKILFQKHAALPRVDQLMLWRFSGGNRVQSDSLNLMNGVGIEIISLR
jgi:hypothetical protein